MEWAAEIIKYRISELGSPVTLKGTENVETSAILDPVQSVSRAARSAEMFPDGYFPPGSYQYFGLPEADLSAAETVSDGDRTYLIRRAELYRCGDTPLYWWGLLIRGEEENDDA